MATQVLPKQKLTKSRIREAFAAAAKESRNVWVSGGNGLFLICRPGGTGTWNFKAMIDGVAQKIWLGKYNNTAIDVAYALADIAREDMQKVKPSVTKLVSKDAETLAGVWPEGTPLEVQAEEAGVTDVQPTITPEVSAMAMTELAKQRMDAYGSALLNLELGKSVVFANPVSDGETRSMSAAYRALTGTTLEMGSKGYRFSLRSVETGIQVTLIEKDGKLAPGAKPKQKHHRREKETTAPRLLAVTSAATAIPTPYVSPESQLQKDLREAGEKLAEKRVATAKQRAMAPPAGNLREHLVTLVRGQALGKTIQQQAANSSWFDVREPDFINCDPQVFRIKPDRRELFIVLGEKGKWKGQVIITGGSFAEALEKGGTKQNIMHMVQKLDGEEWTV